jgi:hypothetical protein
MHLISLINNQYSLTTLFCALVALLLVLQTRAAPMVTINHIATTSLERRSSIEPSTASTSLTTDLPSPSSSRANRLSHHLKRRGIKAFFRGLKNKIVSIAKNTFNAIRNPKKTLKSIAYAIKNPIKTVKAFVKKIKEGCKGRNKAECAGEAVGQVGATIASLGAAPVAAGLGASSLVVKGLEA